MSVDEGREWPVEEDWDRPSQESTFQLRDTPEVRITDESIQELADRGVSEYLLDMLRAAKDRQDRVTVVSDVSGSRRRTREAIEKGKAALAKASEPKPRWWQRRPW